MRSAPASSRPRPSSIAVLGVATCAAVTFAGNDGPIVGLDDLENRLGAASVPTGRDIVAAQVEFAVDGAYGPDRRHPEFTGKTFLEQSGPAGVSVHATTVGRDLYGLTDSIAPDIELVHLYDAAGWALDDYLRTNFPNSVPAAPPPDVLIINNSWIATFDNAAIDDSALRRADFAVERDGLLMTNGVNNGAGAGHWPLMTYMYNGLSVGRLDGAHASEDTAATHEGPGRMKPEILAPGNATSWATAVVGAAAALMLETALGLDADALGLRSVQDATRTEVIKAVLLAGTSHRESWSNQPAAAGSNRGFTARPLDPILGVDLLDVDASHRILTSRAVTAESVPPASCTAGPAGWSLATIHVGGSAFYRFELPATVEHLSVIATWHRRAEPPFTSSFLADVDLQLWRVGSDGGLESLVGDAGLDAFTAGNVVSASAVDNVEHLYVLDLAAGAYVLEAYRVDEHDELADWDVAIAWRTSASDEEPGGDVTGDGVVNVDDLVAVIVAWGPCGCCVADLDGNGVVDVDDLVAVLLAWPNG